METTDLVERLLLRAREFERATDFGGKMMDDARNRLEAAQSALRARVSKLEGYIRRLGENAALAAKSYADEIGDLKASAKASTAIQERVSKLERALKTAALDLHEAAGRFVAIKEVDPRGCSEVTREAARRADAALAEGGPQLTPEEEAELVERINANPNLRPLAEGERG